jgi:pentatricopeptide repeat protein
VKGLITAAAVALIMAAFAIWHLRSPKTDAAQVHIQSIAVLPFQNLSGNASQEYLADGLSEELTARLASIRGLRVTSRTSARQFKDSKQSAPEIAKTLGVDALVEGSVIREGNRVRVHAQLIRGTTDEHMWAASYDREMRDALPLEGELAQTIAEKIRITTTGDEHTRLTRAPVVDPEVYENYLKGRYSGAKSRAELEQSIRYFEDSIRKDPTFAPAYVGMAEAYETLGTIFIGERPEITRPKVMWASQKALELDPSLIEAHTLLARVYQETWRWADAENENRRALDLNPNDGNAHLGMAKWLLSHGRIEEALQESERAHQLDPFGVSGIMGGWILYQGRRYDEALRQLRSVPPEHPDYANAQFFLGFVLLAKGQRDEAVSVLEHTLELTRGGIGVRAMLIHAYVQSGQREKALRMVNELKQQRRTGYVPAGAFVNIYAGMKDREQTLFWLEKAAEEHSNILQFIKTHPHFDFIRDDPRFQELVQRVGLQ